MGKLFGTDGIRGVVNAGLDADLAYKVGLAAAQVLARDKQPGEKPLVTIGKDTRISGDLLKGSLIAGLCTAGADVLDLGTLPTPGVALHAPAEPLYGHNDHRIVMALAVAVYAAGLPALLHGAEAVNKSWPAFWDTLRGLGAKIDTE